jgi:hypothetical protein
MAWPSNVCWTADWAIEGRTDQPDRVLTPWGQEWRRRPDGLYLPEVPERPLSLGALLNVSAAWRVRSNDAFTQTRRGRLYTVAGDRLAFLWRHPRTDRWSAGHLAAFGDRDGQWLERRVGMWLALDTALAYCRRHRDELPVQVDYEQACARLDTPPPPSDGNPQ